MTIQVCSLSQKGGVGKSTITRAIATELALREWRVKIADFDIKQGTCVKWNMRRQELEVSPEVSVESFKLVDKVQQIIQHFDIVLYDGQPHSSEITLKIAQACDKILLPTGLSRDDLEPSILLAHELVNSKIPRNKIAFVLCRVGDSDIEVADARDYISRAGYISLAGEIPEKVGYRRAMDDGKSITESTHYSLRYRAEKVIHSIIKFIIQEYH